MDQVANIIEALRQLHGNPDPAVKSTANDQLSHFRQYKEAWHTAEILLFADESPVEAKIFAAQTFRNKITFDLSQISAQDSLALRDNIVRFLFSLPPTTQGYKIIMTQLCVALADLALQTPTDLWKAPALSMIAIFGNNASMSAVLLEYLKVLAEEYANNMKFDVRNTILTAGDEESEVRSVMNLLTMYIQAPDVPFDICARCLDVLVAWVASGLTRPSEVIDLPLMDFAMMAFRQDALFDSAVELIVSMVNETPSYQMGVDISALVSHINTLEPLLDSNSDDIEEGLSRIFIEACEHWTNLVVRNPIFFQPILNGLLRSSSVSEYAVVNSTWYAWQGLAHAIQSFRSKSPSTEGLLDPLKDIFSSLFKVFLSRIQFPEDLAPGQDTDDFRQFRLAAADVLQLASSVLGLDICVDTVNHALLSGVEMSPDQMALFANEAQSVDPTMIASAPKISVPSSLWPSIEGPLYALQSLCQPSSFSAAIANEQTCPSMTPAIVFILRLDMDSYRVRHASNMVISRFTQWIKAHPSYLPALLNFVTAGFFVQDRAVKASSGHAFRSICRDCARQLGAYIPDLILFYNNLRPMLTNDDLFDIVTAIAHLVAASDDAPHALLKLTTPDLSILAQAVQEPGSPDALHHALLALHRLEEWLRVIGTVDIPSDCAPTLNEVWNIVDKFISLHGSERIAAERVCGFLRRALIFLGHSSVPFFKPLVARVGDAFCRSGESSYLWITGRAANDILNFDYADRQETVNALKAQLVRDIVKCYELVTLDRTQELTDVLEDYINLFENILYTEILADFPALHEALAVLVLAVNSYSDRVYSFAIFLSNRLFELATAPSPSSQVLRANIAAQMSANNHALSLTLLNGLLDGIFGPEEDDIELFISTVKNFFHIDAQLGYQIVAMYVESADALRIVPADQKMGVLERLQPAAQNGDLAAVSHVLVALMRLSRKYKGR